MWKCETKNSKTIQTQQIFLQYYLNSQISVTLFRYFKGLMAANNTTPSAWEKEQVWLVSTFLFAIILKIRFFFSFWRMGAGVSNPKIVVFPLNWVLQIFMCMHFFKIIGTCQLGPRISNGQPVGLDYINSQFCFVLGFRT